jgi:hypothetical protein
LENAGRRLFLSPNGRADVRAEARGWFQHK